MSSYLTLARDGEAEIEVKRSRFLCTLVRVEDEAVARGVVERLRKEHWDARHHCSAFRIGPPPGPAERSQPRPRKGIAVAITVICATFAPSGSEAM